MYKSFQSLIVLLTSVPLDMAKYMNNLSHYVGLQWSSRKDFQPISRTLHHYALEALAPQMSEIGLQVR